MKKILLFITTGLVAFASIFAFTNISSVSASSINGNPGQDTILSYLYRVKTYNRGSNTDHFDTNTYANYATRNILQLLDFNTVNADFGADYSDRLDNKGYTVVYSSDMVVQSAGTRPTQYEFSVSSNTSTTAYYYSQFFFNAGNNYSGSVVLQFPNFAYYLGGVNNNAVLTTATMTFSVFYTPRTDYQTRSLTYNTYVSGNYTYLTFDIPDNTELNDFVVFYTRVYNSTNIGTGSFFTYNFVNMTLQDDDDVRYAIGYNDGLSSANNTVSTGSASYQAGLSDGITQANNTIYTSSASYEAGYNAGLNDSTSLTGLFGSVIQAPVDVVLDALEFEIFGINVSTFVLSLLTIGFISIIFKLLL